jgi:hypothetical protein
MLCNFTVEEIGVVKLFLNDINHPKSLVHAITREIKKRKFQQSWRENKVRIFLFPFHLRAFK